MTEIKSQERYAIFEDEKQITDFIWIFYGYVDDKIIVSNKEKTCIYDTESKSFIIEVAGELYTYDRVQQYAVIRSDGKYGVYDFNGKEILPMIFKEIEIEELFFKVRNEQNMYGIFSIAGKELVPIRYDGICEDECVFDASGQNLQAIRAMKDGMFGWFVVATNSFFDGDDINITKTGLIEICKNDNWELLK